MVLRKENDGYTVKLIALGVLTVLIVGSAYMFPQTLVSSSRFLLAATSSREPFIASQAGSLERWSQFCLGTESYTLLSIPPQASFDMQVAAAHDAGSSQVARPARSGAVRSRSTFRRAGLRRAWHSGRSEVSPVPRPGAIPLRARCS